MKNKLVTKIFTTVFQEAEPWVDDIKQSAKSYL